MNNIGEDNMYYDGEDNVDEVSAWCKYCGDFTTHVTVTEVIDLVTHGTERVTMCEVCDCEETRYDSARRP
jgi:hypothetical protein